MKSEKLTKKIVIIILLAVLLSIGIKLVHVFLFSEKVTKTEIAIVESDLDIVFGLDSAAINVYLYYSYNCAFCQLFFDEAFKSLNSEYIKNGKVKLVLKPVELTHDEYVLKSLKLLVCINKFGNVEKLNELLLADPKVVYTPEFDQVLQEFIEMDVMVAECMLGGSAENYLLANFIEFKQLDLTGTPTFIINNRIYKGFKNYPLLKEVLEKELSNALP